MPRRTTRRTGARLGRWVGGLLLLGAVCVGCVARRGAGAEPREPITVHVTNQSWAAVRVFVARPELRLGVVTSGRSQRLRVPAGTVSASHGLILGVRPIGSREVILTEALHVPEGQVVYWTITEPLSYSAITAMVRDPD